MKQIQNKHNSKEQNQIITAATTTISGGLFPPPEMLKGYQNISPDIMERIIRFTEINGEHRMKIDKEIMNHQKTLIDNSHTKNMTEIKQQNKGQNFAFGVVIMFLGASLFSAFNSYETLSIVLGSATAATGIVNAFLKVRQNKNNIDAATLPTDT
jgi:uncharacterized membrane protein